MAKPVNLEVKIGETRGDIARLIKKFIKKTKKLGLIDEIRNRYYEKPSIARRRRKLQRVRAARKAERERRKQLNIE